MKKILLLIVLVSIRASLIAQIPMDSLVAYYPFNGNVNDSSGNGFNAILGGQTLDTGVCSSGYRFFNNYMDCGDPIGNEFDLVNDATISLWVNLSNYASNFTTLIGKDVGAGNNNEKWFLAMTPELLTFHINGPGWGVGYWCISDTFNFALNTFYHIVITKSANNYEYFINATPQGSDSLPFNILDVPATLNIGQNDVGEIDAVLDEILIYNRVLTQTEITQLYTICGTTTISETNLNNELLVSPNPTNGQFTIALPTENAEITVTDILGQQILKTQTTQKTTNLQLDNNGVYIVYAKTKQGATTRKLVVNR